ncbi:MAG: hypothetical protein ACRC3Z_06535 [Phocaeicola sp.]
MENQFYFPFGQPLKKVEQKDRSPKKAFVLGVYASAVHARWTDKNGKQKVSAFAVASEPDIFWKGENAEEIINRIVIPRELGKLTLPTDKRLNGPSGRALDEKFLKPLNLNRDNTWLCDLLPYSRVNENQKKVIEKHYTKELIELYNLPEATIPNFDKKELDSEKRREKILEELEQSKVENLILLGDLPIKWFLNFYDKAFKTLSQFGETVDEYGKGREIKLNNRVYNVIALCHPRQADRLGSSSNKWGELHDNWINQQISKP